MLKRIQELKSTLNNITESGIFYERMTLLEEANKKFKDNNKGAKYAKSFTYLLNSMSVFIKDNELIVGSIKEIVPTKKQEELFNDIAKNNNFSAAELFTFDPLNLIEIKDPESRYAPSWFNHWGHFTPDWETLLRKGYVGLKKDAEDSINKYKGNNTKLEFLNNVIQVCDGVLNYINRYSKEAKKKAELEKDPVRKEELKKIAKTCSNISNGKPNTFQEAIQLIWFTYMILQCVCGARDYALGRMDKYLIELYKKDLKNEEITREKAKELLQCLFIKLNEIIGRGVEFFDVKRILHVNSLQYIILGGCNVYGIDEVNELSNIILEGVSELELKQPTLVIRYHENIDMNFFNKACELAKKGLGYPTFYNDKVVIDSFINSGIDKKEAVEYVHYGCNNPNLPGKEDELREVWHNIPKYLELALNEGKCLLTDNTIGPKTKAAEQIESLEDLLEQFRLQIRNGMNLTKKKLEQSDTLWNKLRPFSFESVLLKSCIKKGEDMSLNGVDSKHVNNHGVGIATAANSLYAINELVFKQKKYSLNEIKKILKNNFKGYEKLRLELKNKYPKFGNDIESVDKIAEKIGKIYCKEVLKAEKVDYNNRKMWASFYSLWHHRAMGNITAATADGRINGEPLSESQSPVYDTEVNGPTAVLNSLLNLPFNLTPGGGLNIKFQPSWLRGKDGTKILEGLIRGYFKQGGLQMQINVIDKETLIDAKKNPDKHKNLLVRVVGYSAYFVTLSPQQQDEIIDRTEL